MYLLGYIPRNNRLYLVDKVILVFQDSLSLLHSPSPSIRLSNSVTHTHTRARTHARTTHTHTQTLTLTHPHTHTHTHTRTSAYLHSSCSVCPCESQQNKCEQHTLNPHRTQATSHTVRVRWHERVHVRVLVIASACM